MSNKFSKRIFTVNIFKADITFLIKKTPIILQMFRSKTLDKIFIKKIMTVTTAVNGCIYCSWFHAKQALSMGISKEEIKNMLNLEFNTDVSEYEMMGLLFAQHYAETNRNPDEVMTKKLFEYYGKKVAENIILSIRMIYFGNLLGNTWEAFLNRLKGNEIQNGNVFFEVIFALLIAPFMIPAMYLMKYKH